MTQFEPTYDFSGGTAHPVRVPFSPKSTAEVDNIDHHLISESIQTDQTIQTDSGCVTSSADCSMQLDEDNNCFGFAIVRCRIYGKERMAVYTPTDHHKAIFTYMSQTRREGLTHREDELSSLKLMEKMDNDRRIRDEMTGNLISDGLKAKGTIKDPQQPASGFNNNQESVVEVKKAGNGAENPNPGASSTSHSEFSRKIEDKLGDSRMSLSSLAKSSSSFVKSTLSHLLRESETDTASGLPFREQFGLTRLGSHWGKSIPPEALSSKRSFPGLYPADSYS